MKKAALSFPVVLLSGCHSPAAVEPSTRSPLHPRLIVTNSTWQELQARRKHTPIIDRLLRKMEGDGRALITAAPSNTISPVGVCWTSRARHAHDQGTVAPAPLTTKTP